MTNKIYFILFYSLGKRALPKSSANPIKKKKNQDDDDDDDDDDDADEDDEDAVKIVEEDFEGIDKSNIISRTRRRAAVASGLVRENVNRPSSSSGGFKSKISKDDSDEEAEF